MRSALYTGTVKHARLGPRPHAFRYRVSVLALDLDELPEVFRGRWLWSLEHRNVASFRRADYLGPAEVALPEAVRARPMSTVQVVGEVISGRISPATVWMENRVASVQPRRCR